MFDVLGLVRLKILLAEMQLADLTRLIPDPHGCWLATGPDPQLIAALFNTTTSCQLSDSTASAAVRPGSVWRSKSKRYANIVATDHPH